MRIVLAAWHLCDFNVGLGRYCRGLIEGIGRVDRSNQYVILTSDDSHRFPEQPNIRYQMVRFPLFKRRFWEQAAPMLVGPHDVLHLPYDSCVAWRRARLVTTVHDVKPLLFPALAPRPGIYSAFEKMLIRDKWASIDHIITDSECSRRDILRYLPVRDNRLTVVYPGIDLGRFQPSEGGSRSEVRGSRLVGQETSNVELRTVSERPYILSVAGADPTKNVETLVEAFGRLPLALREAYDLVLVGDFRRRPELRERAASLGIERQTKFPGVVDDDRLIELYRQASLFVFPSRYEGFGLPVLEAMACGCPVISSNASSLPEVTGDAAVMVDPMDVAQMAKEMERVLSDQPLADELRRRGPIRAAHFTWDRTARELVSVYKRVLEGSCES